VSDQPLFQPFESRSDIGGATITRVFHPIPQQSQKSGSEHSGDRLTLDQIKVRKLLDQPRFGNPAQRALSLDQHTREVAMARQLRRVWSNCANMIKDRGDWQNLFGGTIPGKAGQHFSETACHIVVKTLKMGIECGPGDPGFAGQIINPDLIDRTVAT
jgi:hypothetical protein